MVDGSGLRRPATTESPWWSDALADPWRDPATPAEVVVPARPVPESPPPLEPVVRPRHRPGRLVALVLVTALLTGVAAGALGGVLGYTYASRGTGTVLGAASGSDQAAVTVQHPPESLAQVVDRVLPSVVTIRVSYPGGRNLGSGFVISADGFLLTNDHVVGGAVDAVTVSFHDGSEAAAQVVGRDPESDLAVLKVERAGLAPVRFGDSEQVAVGDPVLAVGSPLSLANTVTSGIVSAVDRTIGTGRPGGTVRYYAAIQTDAAVNQGNSGGPLVDVAGRVIGVNAIIKSVAASEAGAGNIGLAFAIPIRQAQRVATEIIETGRASRTVFGAELDDAARGGDGVKLVGVVDGGPAERAGLRAGDVVTGLDRRPLETPTDLVALVRKYDPGTKVRVEYRRGSTRGTTTVRLVADR